MYLCKYLNYLFYLLMISLLSLLPFYLVCHFYLTDLTNLTKFDLVGLVSYFVRIDFQFYLIIG